ncbi:MAG: hypothetical protein U0V75_17910 [Ferruginibacter sp.]
MANHCWPLAIKPKELKRLRDQKLGVEQKLMIIFRAGKKATKQIWKTDCPALRLRLACGQRRRLWAGVGFSNCPPGTAAEFFV